MAPRGSAEAFATMRKVELHRHLEGSIRPCTLLELTVETGMRHGDYVLERPRTDLTSFLEHFWHHQRILRSPDIVERVAFEACEDARTVENVRLLELRYSPFYIAIDHPACADYGEVHRAVLRGVLRAKEMYPDLAVGIIGIIDRMQSAEDAAAVMEFFIDNRGTFVGVDLANDEIKYESDPFEGLFQKAIKEGLHVTIHAGEVDAERGADRVRYAVERLGAKRIGHGIMSVYDNDVLKLLRERNVLLEICPTSNWMCQSIPSYADHPIRRLLDAGVACAIGTDDPGLFGMGQGDRPGDNITLNHEYEFMHKKLGITDRELLICNERAAAASFIPAEERARVWRNVWTAASEEARLKVLSRIVR